MSTPMNNSPSNHHNGLYSLIDEGLSCQFLSIHDTFSMVMDWFWQRFVIRANQSLLSEHRSYIEADRLLDYSETVTIGERNGWKRNWGNCY